MLGRLLFDGDGAPEPYSCLSSPGFSVNCMTSVREKKRGAQRSRVNWAGAVARVLNRGGRARIALLMSNRSPLGRSDGRASEYHSCIPVPHHSHHHLSGDRSASP
ncbi:hypothetical protein CRENBAI_006102 [Crenichthys baileyi]|uniref:Uncharacterized protein n=1 Tax=Crenichthys baileyi TaxID=28760 RepID=A0AAV9SFE1_9TELE